MPIGWLRSGANAVQGGADAAETLEALFEAIAAGQPAAYSTILTAIAGNDALPTAVRALASRFLDDEEIEVLHRYFKRLEEIEAQPDGKRVFGWPARTWNASLPAPDFSITLSASGTAAAGAHLIIGNDSDPFDDPLADGRLAITGKLTGKAGAQATLPDIGLGGSADASLERTIAYELQYPRDIRGYTAVAEGIRRLSASLDDFDEMLDAFEPTERSSLRRTRYSGKQALTAAAQGSVAFPIHGAGSVGLDLSANVSTGTHFRVEIERGSTDGSLLLKTVGGDTNASVSRIAVSYKLGISDLSTELVKQIARRLGDLDDLLAAIDEVLGGTATWLKPGTALKDELGTLLREKLGGDGAASQALRATVGDWLSIGAAADENTISMLLRDELAAAIDESSDFFSAETDTAQAIQKLASNLVGELSDEAAGALNDALDSAGAWLDAQIADRAAALDDKAKQQLDRILGRDPEDLVAGLREFLKTTRDKIGQIAKGVEASNLELLAAQIAWARQYDEERKIELVAEVDSAGKDFYRRAIRNPSTAVQQALSGTQGDGVTVRSGTLATGASLITKGEWNVSILDLPFGGSSQTLADVRVARTPSGVTIGTEARIEKAVRIASDSRAVTFADASSLGVSGETEVARISLNFTHVDGGFFGGWSGGEIKDFLDGFIEAGMLDVGVRNAVLERFREVRDSTGASKVDGSLSVILALPPSQAAAVLSYADSPGAQSVLLHAVAEALMGDSDSRTVFAQAVADALVHVDEPVREAFVERGGATALSEARFSVSPVKALEALDAGFIDAASSANLRSEAVNLLESARGAYRSLRAYVGFLGRIRSLSRDAREGDASPEQLEALRERLLEENRDQVAAMRENWIRTGGLPIFAHPPKRTVALFRVLRALARHALELPEPPPVIVKFDPVDHAPTFYSRQLDD